MTAPLFSGAVLHCHLQGFELSQFRLRPKAINPKTLNNLDWDKAWQLLQEKLPGYSQTYGSES
jgi:hypothetical protein